MITTIYFNDTYLYAASSVSGPREKEGPLGIFLDYSYLESGAECTSFEQAETKMIDEAIQIALNKAKITSKDIGVCFGGDLTNQISSSNEAVKNLPFSFIGVYGACSTSMLSLALAASYVSNNICEYALAFTSSNYGSAERQFRYPLQYGVRKKATATITVSGAGCGIVSKKESKVKIISATFGKVNDIEWDDVNNMGGCMAYAAFDTIINHLKNTKTTLKDYDLIITGDLSEVGSAELVNLFNINGLKLVNYVDAGNLIYDKKRQNEVFSGGSGCACLALTCYGFVVEKMIRRELYNVLLVGTGCLHSKISASQKLTIPVIAHAVNLRRV